MLRMVPLPVPGRICAGWHLRCQPLILARMGYFPRPAPPKELLADLRGLFSVGRRHKLVFGAMAVGMTSIIITGFVLESRHGVLPGASTIYAADWSANRTDAEIIKQQKIDQKVVDTYKAEKRRQFQKVDDAMTRWGL
ncbi:hypothetical protein Q4F19_05700 [Sphingomonas sp. BIUV-7]|uniref:Uncharacterized protein n=1 Tax=Sphingomonas natans TaxID=3063330 RepID=A0ABT8Y6C6_9SPHN|nr:hypothetical protein [Sphingomonas sp. BIUV-7]MDO6413868.1 hypothetical protein [Sphingomonas sp. BIUV-7]